MTVRQLKVGAKRRAAPEWSAPSEILIMALDPAYCSVAPSSAGGLGAPDLVDEALRGKFDSCRKELVSVHAHVRTASQAPCVANLSKAFLLDKGNNLEGLSGQRILHLYCSYWRSFFGAALQKEQKDHPAVWPDWFHAYLPSRRREGAMVTRRCVANSLAKLRLPFLGDLRDMANAFACTRPETLLETLNKLIKDKFFAEFFFQRITNSVVELPSFEGGCVTVVPQTGNVIGSSEGPVFFSDAFVSALGGWLAETELREEFPQIILLHSEGFLVEGGLSTFADDTFMTRVVPSGLAVDAAKTLQLDDTYFNESTSAGGWVQNKKSGILCRRSGLRARTAR